MRRFDPVAGLGWYAVALGAAAVIVAIAGTTCSKEPPTAAPACAVSSDTVKLIIRTDRVDTTIVHVCDGRRVP